MSAGFTISLQEYTSHSTARTLASSTSDARCRYEGMAPLPPPWRLVSPDGMLHFVADDKALAALSKAHKLRNEYLRNVLGFGKAKKRNHKGWQPLASSLPEAWPEEGAKWLLHEPSGLMLVVPDGASLLITSTRIAPASQMMWTRPIFVPCRDVWQGCAPLSHVCACTC